MNLVFVPQAHWPKHKTVCGVVLAKKVKKLKKEYGKDDVRLADARLAAGAASMQHGR